MMMMNVLEVDNDGHYHKDCEDDDDDDEEEEDVRDEEVDNDD